MEFSQIEFNEARAGAPKPKLLLHCCCAPCASYVIEFLSPLYLITALFFNPNIRPREEYDLREGELRKLLTLAAPDDRVDMLETLYEGDAFEAAAAPYWDEPEGGGRCRACFELRLGETAALAAKHGFDCFATTLTVSPHKPAQIINDVGGAAAELYGVDYLPSDFKKRDGYKRSIELSRQYGLYRQRYCGCRSE